MTAPSFRKASSVGATTALLLLAGCGGGDEEKTAQDVPEGAIAVVGDVEISKADLDRGYAQFTKTQPQAPDPPRYRKCIAAHKKLPVAKGTPKPTISQLRDQCETSYEQFVQQVATTLIQAEVYRQAAADIGVPVPSDKQVEARQREAFPSAKAYRQSMAASTLPKKAYLDQARQSLLQSDVTEKLRADAAIQHPTEDDAKSYYEDHKDTEFTIPETRSVTMVANASKAKAEEAKQALEDGASWEDVGKEFSTTAPQGVLFSEYTKTQPNPGVAEMFEVDEGELGGPVKTDIGWAVFEVTKSKPASTTDFEEVKDDILSRVSESRQTEAVTDFVEEFKDKTVCGEGYLVVSLCSNAPDPAEALGG